MSLVPNSLISPAGTYYSVTYTATLTTGGSASSSERWTVQYSTSTIDIGDINRSLGAAVTLVQGPTGPQGPPGGVVDSGITANVVSFGADSTGSLNSQPAFQAAADSLSATGGLIYIPSGTYLLDTSSTAGIYIQRSNIRIAGAGMGVSILKYTSKVLTVEPIDVGTCIEVNSGSVMTDVSIADLTIQDLNTATAMGGGHNPSGIDIQQVDNCTIERVEIIDAKGNAAITVAGGRAGGHGTNHDLIIRDTYIHPSDSGYTERDGINSAGYTRTLITANRIIGVKAHAYEGEGDDDFSAIGNFIDMQSDGLNGFGTIGTRNGLFSGNVFQNIANTKFAFSFINDDNTMGIYNNLVIGNATYNPDSLNAAFLAWQPNAGTDTVGGVGPLSVIGNSHHGYEFILLYSPVPLVHIQGNLVDNAGGATQGLVTGGGFGSFAAGGGLVVSGNVCGNTTAPAGTAWIRFATDADWKTASVAFYGNRVDNARGSLSAVTASTYSGSLAAGTSTGAYTVSIPGVLTGEVLEVVPSAVIPAGVIVQAWASSADTVSIVYTNCTGGGITVPAHTMTLYLDRK